MYFCRNDIFTGVTLEVVHVHMPSCSIYSWWEGKDDAEVLLAIKSLTILQWCCSCHHLVLGGVFVLTLIPTHCNSNFTPRTVHSDINGL